MADYYDQPKMLPRLPEPYRRRRAKREHDNEGHKLGPTAIEVFYRDKWRTVDEWARHYNVRRQVITYRLARAIPFDLALRKTAKFNIREILRYSKSPGVLFAIAPRFNSGPPRRRFPDGARGN